MKKEPRNPLRDVVDEKVIIVVYVWEWFMFFVKGI